LGQTNVFLFQTGARQFHLIRWLRTDCLLPGSVGDAFQFFMDAREPILGPPDSIFSHACQMGLEGIVSKRIESDIEAAGDPQSNFRAAVTKRSAQRTSGISSEADTGKQRLVEIKIASGSPADTTTFSALNWRNSTQPRRAQLGLTPRQASQTKRRGQITFFRLPADQPISAANSWIALFTTCLASIIVM